MNVDVANFLVQQFITIYFGLLINFGLIYLSIILIRRFINS